MNGKEACWNKYGTCQHRHVPALAEQKFPGNVTVIPGKSKWTWFSYSPILTLILLSGLDKDDAMRAPLCTRANSICQCRNKLGCESGKYVYSDSPLAKCWFFLSLHSNAKDKWCILKYIKDPGQPTINCYTDVQYSPTYGWFISKEACNVHLEKIAAQKQAQSASRGKLFEFQRCRDLTCHSKQDGLRWQNSLNAGYCSIIQHILCEMARRIHVMLYQIRV